MFIPSAESHDTSYFMSRYIWNPEDEHVQGGSDFDEMSDSCSVSCSSGSYSNMQDEDVRYTPWNRSTLTYNRMIVGKL